MLPLNCDHLVVGAGSTGLAVVDHLLRREAGSVILVDALETPQVAPFGSRVPLLNPAFPGWREVNQRSHELYEGWQDWIEIDPGLRRCGVLMPTEHQSFADPALEILESEDSARRWSGLGSDGPSCYYDQQGATVSPVSVASALMWRIRKAGGRFHASCALSSIVEKDDGVHFSAGVRQGIAQKVFLCAGVFSLDLLEKQSVRHPFSREAVSIFTLDICADLPPVIYWPDERVILIDNEDGSHDLYLHRALNPVGTTTPSVDWDACSEFRQSKEPWINGFVEATVTKARCEHRIGPVDAPATSVSSAGGRIATPGACGEHSALLFPALAEIAVEKHLSGDVGGLLEDLA
ncbi:MAG: FAD-dependent oxidoreductase [Planctomycetota bacterium]